MNHRRDFRAGGTERKPLSLGQARSGAAWPGDREAGRMEAIETEVRKIAWAMAEAWWRKTHRQAAGVLLDGDSAADYADRCWQEWTGEARSALKAMAAEGAGVAAPKPGVEVLRPSPV